MADDSASDELPSAEWSFDPPVAHYGPMLRGPFRFVVLGLFGLYVVFDLLQRQSYVRSGLAILVMVGLVAYELHMRGLPTLDVHEAGLVVRKRKERWAIEWSDILSVGYAEKTTTLDLRGGRDVSVAVDGFREGEVAELRRQIEHRREQPDHPLTWLG